MTAARDYVRATSSNIASAESATQKKVAKGKTSAFNPKLPKRLTIYVAAKYPSWQEKYIDLVREAFDSVKISLDDKALNGKVAKLGEMKKAMPFVQNLKKRLVTAKEAPETVFERKLAFDETYVLTEMVNGLKKTVGAAEVVLLKVEEGGKEGVTVPEGEKKDGLPPQAEGAVPGQPTFHFENI